jgi:hypothetical protein
VIPAIDKDAKSEFIFNKCSQKEKISPKKISISLRLDKLESK